MFMRYCSLVLFTFLSASCVQHSLKKVPVPVDSLPHKRIQETRSLSSFTQVDVHGQLNVTLHTGYRIPRIVLSGDARDLAQLKTVVSGSTLYVDLGKGFPHHGAVHVDIQGHYLTRFSYRGEGVVSGTQLHTNELNLYLENKGTTRLGGYLGLRRLEIVGNGFTELTGINSTNLQINLKGSPKVQLNGVASISNLMLSGTTWLSMYWLKSDTLVVRAKQGSRVQLAGKVNRLDVELWGRAHFKGRYLRADRSFVKTHGRSVAEISAVNHQSNLATDASDIYYYNLPDTRADFMGYDGSVLDMREWDRINMRDYDRYNKQFP